MQSVGQTAFCQEKSVLTTDVFNISFLLFLVCTISFRFYILMFMSNCGLFFSYIEQRPVFGSYIYISFNLVYTI